MKSCARVIYLAVVLVLAGCASGGDTPSQFHDLNQHHLYPLAIVSAQFEPDITVDYKVTGKGSGAASGALHGIGECLSAGGSGEGGALFAIICLPFGIVGGTLHGATTSESAENIKTDMVRFEAELVRLSKQGNLAEEAASYFRANGVTADFVEAVSGPRREGERVSYSPEHFQGYKGALELWVKSLNFNSTGKKDAPLCLNMTVVGRKLDGSSGKELEQIERTYQYACKQPVDWASEGGKPILNAITTAYTSAAQDVVDDFYFLYYPNVEPIRSYLEGKDKKPADEPEQKRNYPPSAPSFVLTPLQPPLAGEAPDNILSSKPKNRSVYGGMRITKIDSLSPQLEWEAFPRSFDLSATEAGGMNITEVVYDLKLYSAYGTPHSMMKPDTLIYQRSGLSSNQHQLEEQLQPCGWYFWTVRARFRLNGYPRVTEWSGAYAFDYGSHSSSITLNPAAYRRGQLSMVGPWRPELSYYPFRTPAAPAYPDCWDSKSVFDKRREEVGSGG